MAREALRRHAGLAARGAANARSQGADRASRRLFARAGDTIAVCSPSYPVPERSARARELPVAVQTLSAATGWLPDPDASVGSRRDRVGRQPPQPDRRDRPARAARAARRALPAQRRDPRRRRDLLGAVVRSRARVRTRARGPHGRDRVQLAVQALRPRRPALRFIAGDAEIVSRVRLHRSDIGTTPPAIVQLASIAAWRTSDMCATPAPATPPSARCSSPRDGGPASSTSADPRAYSCGCASPTGTTRGCSSCCSSNCC